MDRQIYSNLIVAFSQKETWVYVQIDNKERPTWFNELQRDQEEIAIEFGNGLKWEERQNLKQFPDTNFTKVNMTDRAHWPSVFEWMLNNMIL